MTPKFFSTYDSEDNIPFYIIPAGTTLYRADSSTDAPTYKLIDTGYPIFFGFDKETIEKNYGITYKFTTISDIHCIAIDLLTESSPFYVNSSPKIQKVLRENYGLFTKKRLSESGNDNLLANYICTLGKDGYAANVMETQLGSFHSEIAICNISNKIDPDGILVTPKKIAARLKQEHILIISEKERRERRRRRSNNVGDSPQKSIQKSLFMDSPPNSPPRVTAIPFSFDSPPSSPIYKRGGKTLKKKRMIRKKSAGVFNNKNKKMGSSKKR